MMNILMSFRVDYIILSKSQSFFIDLANLNTLSNLNILNTYTLLDIESCKLKFKFVSTTSIKLSTTIMQSNTLNESLKYILGPKAAILHINSKRNIEKKPIFMLSSSSEVYSEFSLLSIARINEFAIIDRVIKVVNSSDQQRVIRNFIILDLLALYSIRKWLT